MNGYDRLRDDSRYENGLINERLRWLMTFEGLLVIAFSFLYYSYSARNVMVAFCLLGTLVAISIGLGTYRANMAIERIGEEWERAGSDGAGEVEWVKSGGGFWWLMPGYFTPVLFSVFWLTILIDIWLKR